MGTDDFYENVRPRSPAETLEPERAPEPPEQRKRKRGHFLLVLMNGAMSLLVIGLVALGGLFYFAKLQFDKLGPLDHATVFAVPKGEGVNSIAARLEREGVITDRRVFVASVIYFKAQDKLKAGEYEFRKQASMRDVLDKLVQGDAVLHKVTIPEGFTSHQVVARLNEAQDLEGEIESVPPEGSLLPETYKFSRGATRQGIIDRMQAAQRKFLDRLWPKRRQDLPFETRQEALTLASIVEKETSRADERARVAGVFVNRLRKGMPLQSDPTVIYGLTEGEGSLGRPILQSELDKETPYNTYKVRGLPPAPIANPGRSSIEAVLNPASTKDMYFVADGTGGHAFATTLAQHNENVAQWREIARQRRAEAEAARKSAEQAAAGNSGETGAEGQSDDQLVMPTAVPGLTGNSSQSGEQQQEPASQEGQGVGVALSREMLGDASDGSSSEPAESPEVASASQSQASASAAPADQDANADPDVPLPVRNPRAR